MGQDNQFLQAYMDKMLAVHKQREEQYFTPSELKEIALSVGMTEADWAEAQKTFAQHISVGQQHLRVGNYTDALAQFEEALKLNPSHEQALFGAAQAAHERYMVTKSAVFSKKTCEYANRALQNEDPNLDSKAIDLLKSMREADGQHAAKRERKVWVLAAIGGAVVLLLLVGYLVLKNSLNASYHEAEKQWAQVENVCQRRLDLIPKVVALTQAQAGGNEALFTRLEALKKELEQAKTDPTIYAQKQEELNALLNKILAATHPSDEALAGQYRDLRAQIEGAENRISTERKRYNDAVAEHNAKAGKFPYSLVGAPVHKYFRATAAGGQ